MDTENVIQNNYLVEESGSPPDGSNVCFFSFSSLLSSPACMAAQFISSTACYPAVCSSFSTCLIFQHVSALQFPPGI